MGGISQSKKKGRDARLSLLHFGPHVPHLHFSEVVNHVVSVSLEGAQSRRGDSTVFDWWMVDVSPWRAERVTVSVEIAQNVRAARGIVFGHDERLVHGRQERVGEIRHKVQNVPPDGPQHPEAAAAEEGRVRRSAGPGTWCEKKDEAGARRRDEGIGDKPKQAKKPKAEKERRTE